MASEGHKTSPSTQRRLKRQQRQILPSTVGGYYDSDQKPREALTVESTKTHNRAFTQGQSSSGTGCPKSWCSLCPQQFSRPDRSKFRKSSSKLSTETDLSRRMGYRHPKVPFNLNYSIILFCNAQLQNNYMIHF